MLETEPPELLIEENANSTGPDSAWTMETEILFFPRKVQPSVREATNQPDGIPVYEVILPTGEKVLFDKQTKEIIPMGSVLVENSRIDPSPNRATTPNICKVPTSEIWQQSANEGGDGLFGKDDDCYAMLKTKCQWNVKASDFP